MRYRVTRSRVTRDEPTFWHVVDEHGNRYHTTCDKSDADLYCDILNKKAKKTRKRKEGR